MKIYISGKITGTDNYMERFEAAQKELEWEGWSVINLALVNSNLPQDTTWEDYMNLAVCMLDMCETVYFLDGWKESRGANIEYGYALAKNKDILFQEEEYEVREYAVEEYAAKEYKAQRYETEESELTNLGNWTEVVKGLYRYALTESSSYEIHILCNPDGQSIMEAKASLYITGYWQDMNHMEGSGCFKRECLLSEGTVFECLLESLHDH